MTKVKTKTREDWLTTAMDLLDKKFFADKGYELPQLRASCGFPWGSAKAIGQCFDKANSADDTYEIFICPTQAEALKVLDILLHEMIHAAVGIEEGHKGMFRKVAKEFGLAGKMTATYAEEGSELHTQLVSFADKLGVYPHAAMKKKTKPAKPNKWVRYYSLTEEKFRVVVNIDQVELHGVPRDFMGDEMVPVNG